VAINKLFPNPDQALVDMFDGAVVMVGGWGTAGTPQDLILAMIRRGLNGLTCITEACHLQSPGILDLLAYGQLKKLVCPSSPPYLWPQVIEDKQSEGILQLETSPARILAERIRAGGAGIELFLMEPNSDSAPNASTEMEVLDGKQCLVEKSLKADFAIIRAQVADTLGNLTYSGLERNWNPLMATSANVVIALVDQIVEPGGIDPELVITPGIYVDRIVKASIQPGTIATWHDVGPGWTPDLVRERVEAVFHTSLDAKELESNQVSIATPEKVYTNASSAIADIFDGAIVMIDGFGGSGGLAHQLLLALRDSGAKELTIVGNTAGVARVMDMNAPPGFQAIDQNILAENGQLKRAVASFPASPRPSQPTAFELAYRRGEVEVESVPQGTLAERIRAGGHGIAGFYTPTGAGTSVADGKPTRIIKGREHILERAIRADFAILRAHRADPHGNLIYRGTSRNFNPVMAPAADVTIVEVDEIVPVGELDVNAIATTGTHVDRIIKRTSDFFPYEPEL
jgi:3-oxoadipate CoA-transferase alpha subunit